MCGASLVGSGGCVSTSARGWQGARGACIHSWERTRKVFKYLVGGNVCIVCSSNSVSIVATFKDLEYLISKD